ncbi:MAG: hypothetical protein AB4041_09520 [Microcystaceae cyanobacterium]
MSLLRRIQDATIDPAYQLSDVLRMCKILAARLDYPDFKDWIENELNGYDGMENLPNYRVIKSLNCFGNFIGFNARLSNVQIPLSILPENFRATTIYMVYSISSMVDCIDSVRLNRQHSLYYPWPTEMRDYLHDRAYPNMECSGAWTVITTSHLAAIIDTVKSKILDFVLEIEEIAPDVGKAQTGEKPLPEKTVASLFYKCIFTEGKKVEMSNIDIKAEELADKLIQLKAIIEEDHNLPEPDKIEALEQVKTLAEATNNPKHEKVKIATRAIRMLKGIATELPTATQLVEGLNKLLPAIATLLGLD